MAHLEPGEAHSRTFSDAEILSSVFEVRAEDGDSTAAVHVINEEQCACFRSFDA